METLGETGNAVQNGSAGARGSAGAQARARIAQVRARERKTLTAMAQDVRPRAFEVGTLTYVVHLDTYPGRLGKWRVTRMGTLDGALVPFGHETAESYLEALRLADAHLPCAREIAL